MDRILTPREEEEIRRSEILHYISKAQGQLSKDIRKMDYASISGEVSEYNEITHKFVEYEMNKEYAKKQKERLEKSLKSLTEFKTLVENVEYRREHLYQTEKNLIPFEIAKDAVSSEIQENYGGVKDVLGRSQSSKTKGTISTPYQKEKSRLLHPEISEYEKAIKELERYLATSGSAVRKKNGRCFFNFFYLSGSVKIFGTREERVPLNNALEAYIQDIERKLLTFEDVNEQKKQDGYKYNKENGENEYEINTYKADRIKDTIAFYESGMFHGVRITVHGKDTLEKMAKREKLISSIDRAIDRINELHGFEKTRQALVTLKTREEENFEREKEQFEKKSRYNDIVESIKKDAAIDKYADLVREQRASRGVRDEYYAGALEQLEAELGLTPVEVQEAISRVDREEEKKKSDAMLKQYEEEKARKAAGEPSPEYSESDMERYREFQRKKGVLENAVIEYLTEGGTKTGIVQNQVDMMVSRLMDEVDMSPEGRALAALKRQGTSGIDENTSVHNLSTVQRQLVDKKMRIEEKTGITAALNELRKDKEERKKRDNSATTNFAGVKIEYENAVEERNSEKVEQRRGLLSKLFGKKQPEEKSNDETIGVHK